jgi:RNA polymerase sigma-70 factor (ECF subfamily)
VKEQENLEGSGFTHELQSFPAFYQAYERTIRATVFQVLGRDKISELDDLVQLTFIKCWENRTQFQGKSKLSTWVIQIAMNTVRDHFRSSYSKRKYVDLEDVTALENESTQSPDDHMDERRWVEQGLTNLDLEYRTVIALRYFQDLSLEEIAEVTGEKEGTVKSRLHSAKSKLRDFFERKGVKL